MRSSDVLVVAVLGLGACEAGDRLFCGPQGCEFTETEWAALSSLRWGEEVRLVDASNQYVGDPAAIALGHALYFDPRLSGRATLVDMLDRPTQYARALSGEKLDVSCATCHAPARAGSDVTSMVGHVSVGAGLYDVNGQQTVNAAAYDLPYWNGRVDSLWAQAAAVMESRVSMNGNRLAIGWVVFQHYRDAYLALFPGSAFPFPFTDAGLAFARTGVASDGTCVLSAGACPASFCDEVAVDGGVACLPRLPLEGKRGSVDGCQWGSASEPFRDAFDCMAERDRDAVTRLYVNVAKAIAAYEFTLVSKDSPFDRFVEAGPASELLSAEARRGAKLFVGKASCVTCHRTYLFSDQQFHNLGVPQVGVGVPSVADCPRGDLVCDCVTLKNCLPWGAYDGLTKLRTGPFRRDSEWSDQRADASRARWDFLEPDGGHREPDERYVGAWRTPSLRDVALTAPYMHDGLYPQLIDVVWHYNRGGDQGGYAGRKAIQLAPLHLTAQEESDLVAFLESLTGAPQPADVTEDPCRRPQRPSSCPPP